MTTESQTYACLDLKSFYASVECVARGLNPFTTNLVVADPARGERTICLALSPALKKLGLPGRCRVYEIPNHIHYIIARPRMSLYMKVSAQIVDTYLNFVSPDDLHVYSIDECFINLAPYLRLYQTTPEHLVHRLMQAVFDATRITVAAGMGPNLFLAKVALDLFAKHAPNNIAYLDESSFKQSVWTHRPITDIWQIGKGIAARLAKRGIYTLKDVAMTDPEELYQEFGINAEYLIDHAWGLEPCTIEDIKAYTPSAHSVSNGQVLPQSYTASEAFRVLREMIMELTLELTKKQQLTEHISLYVGYDKLNNFLPSLHASKKLPLPTNSFEELCNEFKRLWQTCVDSAAHIRRLSISFGHCIGEQTVTQPLHVNHKKRTKEHTRQLACVAIKQKFEEDALMLGTSYMPKARGLERAHQIGGHHA